MNNFESAQKITTHEEYLTPHPPYILTGLFTKPDDRFVGYPHFNSKLELELLAVKFKILNESYLINILEILLIVFSLFKKAMLRT